TSRTSSRTRNWSIGSTRRSSRRSSIEKRKGTIMATIAPVARPEIALPRTRPHVPVEQYARRIERVHAAMVEENLDFLVVYGDRVYSGDLHQLTALDPRFEEAIAVFGTDGARHILLGNENIPLAPDPSLGFAVTLFQELSPQGQLRHRPVELEDVLRG